MSDDRRIGRQWPPCPPTSSTCASAAAGRTAACTGSGFSSSPPAAPAARRWPSSSCPMYDSVARAHLATTRPVGEGCSARGDARARIPEGSSSMRRRSPRRRSWTGSVEVLPGATFPAARAVRSRPRSCLAADVVGVFARARLSEHLKLDYKGVSGPERDLRIAVWYGNAQIALFSTGVASVRLACSESRVAPEANLL